MVKTPIVFILFFLVIGCSSSETLFSGRWFLEDNPCQDTMPDEMLISSNTETFSMMVVKQGDFYSPPRTLFFGEIASATLNPKIIFYALPCSGLINSDGMMTLYCHGCPIKYNRGSQF
jgi:hypothetical protein